jgi:hypothetical protein
VDLPFPRAFGIFPAPEESHRPAAGRRSRCVDSEPPISLRQVDPLIRQLNLYRDLIEERTQQNTQEPE